MTTPSSVPAQGEAIIEQIAREWDGCTYEALGADIDIGEAIRRTARALVAASPCAAIPAHSKSEYKRLTALGADAVLPAAAQGGQQPEPVARVRVHRTGGNAGIAWSAVPLEGAPTMRDGELLYTAAAPAPAAPLTAEQIEIVLDAAKVPEYPGCETIDIQIARAIERAHGITLTGTAQKGGEHG